MAQVLVGPHVTHDCVGTKGIGTLADGGRAFPPDDCTSGNPFMAFNGVASGGNTYCINGQSVLNNALPGCAPGQQVTFDGTSFVCAAAGGTTPPDCAAGQFLTFSGGSYSCASTNVPTCQANYVLTYNGSTFTCVPKSASVPTCAANQFLTYNGTSFQCAATQMLTIPSCPSGQVLTGSGGNLTCVTPTSTAGTGDWCGLAWRDATFYDCGPTHGSNYYTNLGSCKGYAVASSCPSGYTQQSISTGAVQGQGDYVFCLRTCIKN